MITGIIGVQRGGTSAVAHVVFNLGLKMWGNKTTLDDHNLYRDISLAKNRKGDWAYKHPMIWQTGKTDIFTDKYIFVFRDAVASAQNGDVEPVEEKIFYRHSLYSTFTSNKPHLYISYEKLCKQPEKEVRRIADFIGVPVTDKAIKAVDFTKGYFPVI